MSAVAAGSTAMRGLAEAARSAPQSAARWRCSGVPWWPGLANEQSPTV